MALQNVGGFILAPEYPQTLNSTAPTFIASVIDADSEGWGMVFQAPETGTITGFGACTGTLTTGDAGTVFALRNVDLTATPGIPGGTTHASGAVNVNASNTWFDVAGLSYAATKGELLSVTITRPASGSLNTQFRGFSQDRSSNTTGFPYCVANVGAGWAVANNSPIFAVNYGGTYHHIRGAHPFSAITSTAFGSGSTPDVIGNVIIPRFKCRASGVWLWILLGGPTAIKLYDTDGVTVLAQATLAANTRAANAALQKFVPFDDAAGAANAVLNAGSTYRIGVEPSSATTISLYDFSVNAAAIMDACGLGQNMYFTSSKNPTGTGDWTDVTTRRCFLGLQIDQLDDGVSAGGSGMATIGQGMIR